MGKSLSCNGREASLFHFTNPVLKEIKRLEILPETIVPFVVQIFNDYFLVLFPLPLPLPFLLLLLLLRLVFIRTDKSNIESLKDETTPLMTFLLAF